MGLASAVIVFLVPIFGLLRDSSPVLAALHPVAALLSFPLSTVVALNSLQALRGGQAHGTQGAATGSP